MYRALRAAAVFVCHAVVTCVVIASVVGASAFLHWLGWIETGAKPPPGHETMLFGRVPLAYLFHAIDVALIALFGGWGIYEAARELFGRDDDNDDKSG